MSVAAATSLGRYPKTSREWLRASRTRPLLSMAQGLLVAWNEAAEALFAFLASEAMGRHREEIVAGADECRPVCSEGCTVRQAIEKRHPISNFDLLMNTATGRQ